MGRKASLATQRATITHVAAICDQREVQHRLPQLVLLGENQMSEARLATLRLSAPECVHMWKYKNAWMNTAIMVRYIGLLGRCLQDYRESHRFILFLDALRAHINAAALRAAAAVGLWVCVFPAGK